MCCCLTRELSKSFYERYSRSSTGNGERKRDSQDSVIPSTVKSAAKVIEQCRSHQNWVEHLMMQVLFNEHLCETRKSLEDQDLNYLLDVIEEITIRETIQEAWQKHSEKSSK